MNHVLKSELGFQGYVLSDWYVLMEKRTHRLPKEGVRVNEYANASAVGI